MAEYFINADSGSNAGAGTSGDPWETLAYAYDNSTTDDIITCQDSTATYDFVSDTLSDRTIRGESDDASGAVFDGGGNDRFWTITGTTLQKITIQNLTTAANSSYPRILYSQHTNTTTVENCVFKDLTLGSSTLISVGGGFFGVQTGEDAALSLVFNNCIFDLTSHPSNSRGADFFFDAFTSSSGDTISVAMTGCTVYMNNFQNFFNARYKISESVTIKNCIIAANTSTTFEGTDISTQDNTYSCFYNVSGGLIQGTGVITSDPLFVDAANGDFRLRPTSPCVATGVLI